MFDSIFNENLEKLSFTEDVGLVYCTSNPEVPAELFAIEQAKRYGVHAVLFRRFFDGRDPVPEVYLYDYTETAKLSDMQRTKIAETHRKLWNAGCVSLFFVVTKTEVLLFNCMKQPEIEKKSSNADPLFSPWEKLKLAAQTEKERKKLQEFRGELFASGAFWEYSEYSQEFSYDKSAQKTLLNELQKVRDAVVEEKLFSPDFSNKLLVMLILAKFLEEQVNGEQPRFFPQGYFEKFSDGEDTLLAVIKNPSGLVGLFDDLNQQEKFNGGIFSLDEDEKEALKSLSPQQAEQLAEFFEGKLDGRQYALWRLYSFKYLPIEVISNIYELFLPKEKKKKQGIVYTPPFLVSLLVNECMPLTSPPERFADEGFRVLDPACGSGIFLVAVFKRLVQWWRIQNNFEKPSPEILKKLLRENIYGVDLESQATMVAMLSLQIALCYEMLPEEPQEPWELHFDDLYKNGNLRAQDFFEVVYERTYEGKAVEKFPESFDLVIGNPPFVSKYSKAGNLCFNERVKREKKEKLGIPDKQIALLFLREAIEFCSSSKRLCFILPAGHFLYNTNSSGFREHFLSSFMVDEILDFTPLRSELFESSDVATCAVLANNVCPPLEHDVQHILFRSTTSSRNKRMFESNYYDMHTVSLEEACSLPFIWKVNLLGGWRLALIAKRFSAMRTLKEFLEEKKEKSGWEYGEGYREGKKQEIDELQELISRESLSALEESRKGALLKKFSQADWITDQPTFDTESLTTTGINSKGLVVQEQKWFLTPRTKKIFEPPHVFIRELEPNEESSFNFSIAYCEDYLTCTAQILSIHAPEKEKHELQQLFGRFQNKGSLYHFFVLAKSGRLLVSKENSLLARDIYNLPYPENEEDLQLSAIETILVEDTLQYIRPTLKSKSKKTAGANKIISLQEQEGKQHLEAYAQTFLKVINSVYKEFQAASAIETEYFICQPFYYGTESKIPLPDLHGIENHLKTLIHDEAPASHLIINRILRLYDHNVIFFVKPKNLRYWLRSVALRDADETFADLVEQEYGS